MPWERLPLDFDPMFAQCDIVFVEGDSTTTSPKIEVWRSMFDTAPLSKEDSSIAAVVTNDHREFLELKLGVSVWPRSDVSVLADAVLALAGK